MTSRKVIYYILAAFIAGNFLLIYLQYNSSKNIDNLINENEKLLNEWKTGNELQELEKEVITFENRMRDAISTNDTTHISVMETKLLDFESSMDNLIGSTDNDSSAVHIYILDSLVREKIKFSREILNTFRHSGKHASEILIANTKSNQLTHEITVIANKIEDERQRLLTSLNDSIDESGRNARRWGTVLIILVLVVASALFWFIINRLTNQDQLIRELDASERKVREAALVKENFMTNMSHEIRTPMNAILGFTNLLQRKELDSESKEYVETIQRSGESLLNIINDILDLSKIEAGMMPLESMPFSIRGMIDTIEKMFREKAREKNLQLTGNVQENVPDILTGDATRLSQILVNLVGNAVKFTEKGVVSLSISSKPKSNKAIYLVIEISDTGIGIEKEKLSRIFERFNQAEDSITRKYGGTGLGLSIVNDLVILHNGNIQVESEKDKGTIFRITIPYLISAEPYSVSPSSEIVRPLSLFTDKVHILVVEDNEINKNLVRHLFKEWQLSFDIVSNGEEAVSILQQRNYSMILMDIQMPVMDGYSATHEIRQKLRLDIPIIAMTAHASTREQEKCLSHGMNGYISKPIREQELYRTITHFSQIKKIPGNKSDAQRTGLSEPYRYINLDYMKEVGGGNREYEKTVTEQFLEMIPEDLQAIDLAWSKRDMRTLKRVAHNMRTSVSVMGLVDILLPHLDILENTDGDEEIIRKGIASVKEICIPAIEEARVFYKSLAIVKEG